MRVGQTQRKDPFPVEIRASKENYTERPFLCLVRYTSKKEIHCLRARANHLNKRKIVM